MRKKKTSLERQLLTARRKARLKPMTSRERLALARKRKLKQKEAESRTLTAAGLAPVFAGRLQAAAKKAQTDPQARALIERARLAKRIDIAKRESGVGDPGRTPTRFMGASVTEYEAAVDSALKVPPRLSDVRKPAEEPKKGRRSAAR